MKTHNRQCNGKLDPLWKVTWSAEKARNVLKKSTKGKARLWQCNKCEKVVEVEEIHA